MENEMCGCRCRNTSGLSSSSRLILLWFGCTQNAPQWLEWRDRTLKIYSTIQGDWCDRSRSKIHPSQFSLKYKEAWLLPKSYCSTSRTAFPPKKHACFCRGFLIRQLSDLLWESFSCIKWLMCMAYFKCHVLVPLLQWPLYCCVDLAVVYLLSLSDAHC